MACTRIAFGSVDWTPGAHPLERKKIGREGLPILIEFRPGFSDPGVCTRGHILFVLSGALGLELTDRREVVRAGECCVIDAGTPHRAFTEGDQSVEIFIASDDRSPREPPRRPSTRRRPRT